MTSLTTQRLGRGSRAPAASKQRPELAEACESLRALAHPAWWLALAVLVANDHVFKTAGWLPGAVTGKLSDLAGLFVAPALLAALVHARTRRSIAVCHLAVGAVFAALQLSAGAAWAWSASLGMLGVSWRTWPDPTDLAALPVLALSWRVLVPWMRNVRHAAPHSPWVPAVAMIVGTAACLATSPPPPVRTPDTANPANMLSDVYLVSHRSITLGVEVRRLRDDVAVDCAQVASDPAGYLGGGAFDDGVKYMHPTNEAVGLWPPDKRSASARARGCYAVQLELDDLGRLVVFWHEGQPPVVSVPISYPTVTSDPGALFVVTDASGKPALGNNGPQTVDRLP